MFKITSYHIKNILKYISYLVSGAIMKIVGFLTSKNKIVLISKYIIHKIIKPIKYRILLILKKLGKLLLIIINGLIVMIMYLFMIPKLLYLLVLTISFLISFILELLAILISKLFSKYKGIIKSIPELKLFTIYMLRRLIRYNIDSSIEWEGTKAHEEFDLFTIWLIITYIFLSILCLWIGIDLIYYRYHLYLITTHIYYSIYVNIAFFVFIIYHVWIYNEYL